MQSHKKTEFYDAHYHVWRRTVKQPSSHYAHTYLEKPAMAQQLEAISRIRPIRRMLVVGCGSGEELEMIMKYTDSECTFVCIDSSDMLMQHMRYTYADCSHIRCITLHAESVDELHTIHGLDSFDCVYSSLTLHYIQDWDSLLAKLALVCDTGAFFIFSVQHPIKWSAYSYRSAEYNQFVLGYTKVKRQQTNSRNNHAMISLRTDKGEIQSPHYKGEDEYHVFGNYLQSHEIHDTLLGSIPITYHHKSMSTIFTTLLNSGWHIEACVEPTPTDKIKHKADFYEVYSRIPLFLLFRLRLQ